MSEPINIVLFGQYGGPDIPKDIIALGRKLKAIFKTVNRNTYSDDIHTIAFNLCVSGKVTTFEEPSGFIETSAFLKRREVKCDMVIQKDIWTKGPDATWAFYQKLFHEAFEQIRDKLKKKKVPFDMDALQKDLKALGL